MDKYKTYIPNLNTVSTLIDRLSIENVKLAHFHFQLESEDLTPEQRSRLVAQGETQVELIGLIKEELEATLNDILISNRYDFVQEERTFG